MKCLLCDKTEVDPGRVCSKCARLEDRRLREIDEWYADLTGVEPLPDHDDAADPEAHGVYALSTPDRFRPDRAWPLQPRLLTHADPVASAMPAGMTRSRTNAPRVSGSREAPLPLPVDHLDLTMPARVPHVTGELVPATRTETVTAVRRRIVVFDRHIRHPITKELIRTEQHVFYLRGEVKGRVRVPLHWRSDGRPRVTPTDDQAGQLAAATVLDGWVREWRWHRDAGEGLPEADVPTMVEWLRNRLWWALDSYEDVPAYSREIRALHGALRAAVGDVAPPPERCHGVPCKSCDKETLFRTTDGSGDVECADKDCGRLLDEDEYKRWVKLVAANPRAKAESGRIAG